MLLHLHVKNLALIEEVEVDFEEGLNILTGETGAGKSILIGSLNLALGKRASKELIRNNAEYALVELVFEVKQKEQLDRVRELDIPVEEDGQIIISRRISETRSVSKVNGELVTASVLQQIQELLINIHGQHENQSLTNKKKHLELLDEFGQEEIGPVALRIKSLFRTYTECQNRLQEFEADESSRAREISLLQYEIQEISQANLQPGEDTELEQNYRRMLHGKKIAEVCQTVYGLTQDTSHESAGDCVGRAVREMNGILQYDENLNPMYQQLEEIENLLADFNCTISQYAQDMEFSQSDFLEAENRLDTINHLKAKYGDSVDKIVSYAKKQEERLSALLQYEETMHRYQKEWQEAKEQLEISCLKLSELRKQYASVLTEKIREALLDLNFHEVRFEMEFSKTPHYQENGADQAEFMISLNQGEPLRSLGAVASGGELSRIMLAIKAVMAQKDDVDTLIFDEIDAGISGRTAQKVSEKLAVIAGVRQVICITHLAQIAAMADTHFQIIKTFENNHTITTIHKLDEKEMIEELARILGGAEITETIRKSACEMKELAKRTK